MSRRYYTNPDDHNEYIDMDEEAIKRVSQLRASTYRRLSKEITRPRSDSECLYEYKSPISSKLGKSIAKPQMGKYWGVAKTVAVAITIFGVWRCYSAFNYEVY